LRNIASGFAVPWRRFFRILFLVPLTITPVGIGYMFLMMTDTSKGPFEPLWVAFGLRNFTWVTDPWLARLAVVIGDTWQWTPFTMLIVLGGLAAIPTDPYESATIDGANLWQLFRYITLPLVMPFILIAAVLRTIDAFKAFDTIYPITQGGPGTASQTINIFLYLQAFSYTHIGNASAVVVVFFAMILVLAYLMMYMRQRSVWE